MMLNTGIKGRQTVTVTKEMSAKAMGSGTLDVFATPAMLALMEKTAMDSITPYLEEGQSSVGTKVDITHDAATPLGMQVTCESELMEVDDRRLVFQVDAYDEAGRIGGGRHERFLIRSEGFQAKADRRGNK